MKQKDISLKKLPPHNNDAEQSVLGAILLENDSISKALGIIKPSDFYQPSHQKIFKGMLGMSARGEIITLLTLSESLLRSGNLEIIGGPPYLMDLMEATPTATTITHHAKIIKEKSQLRTLIAISTQLKLEAYGDRVDPEKLLTNVEQLLYDLRSGFGDDEAQWLSLGDTIPSLFEDIERIYDDNDHKTDTDYIKTGFTDYDNKMIGLAKSDMIVVAARPSMGKTAFVFNIAVNVATNDIPVAIFSIETSNKKASERMLCTDAGVSSDTIHKGWIKDKHWPILTTSMGKLNQIPLYIYDSPTLTPQDLRIKTKQAIKDYGIKLVLIDYLQLMHIPGVRDHRIMFTDISRAIKAVAREFDIPVVAISQLNRKVEERKPPRPVLSDLRETGAIEQDADQVVFIFREPYYTKKKNELGEPDLTAEIIISKNRNGPTGTIKMIFEPRYTKFKDFSIEGGAQDEM